jgi:hypothetical protein
MKNSQIPQKLGWVVAWVACSIALGAVRAFAIEPPRKIDARRLAAAGLRVLEGRHLRLVTDLPSSPAVDELPAVFDAAVPEWAAYFDVPPAHLRVARWVGFLIQDREKFAALGLIPAENPNFPSGFARDWEFWLVEQPSDYYRRHLLLHEGTHAFMQTQLGGCGPGWYMEGMAELLGTHEWSDGRLRLGIIPASRDDVPMWGRVKLVRDAFAADRPWPLEAVLAVNNSRVMSTDQYAWTWALAALLDAHPQFQERFRGLRRGVTDPQFTPKFRRMFAGDWSDLAAEWQAYIAELDYGYDIPRMAMVHKDVAPVDGASRRATVDATRGWQSTGWLLRAGKEYRLAASGRYTIADDGQPWPCEPGGVTIDYHRGRPLGALLGALRPTAGHSEPALGHSEPFGAPQDRHREDSSPPSLENRHNANASFAHSMLIGLGTTVRPDRDAVLYVRVNDSPAKLHDNAGNLTLKIEQVPIR